MSAKTFVFLTFPLLLVSAQTERVLQPSEGRGGAAKPYFVFLRETPLVEQMASRAELKSVRVQAAERRIELEQQDMMTRLGERKIRTTGRVQTLLNAIFVAATEDQANQIRGMTGVEGVIPARAYQRRLNRAAELVNAPAAWQQIGGPGNAGTGVRIAVLDTGIDITHPGMQDDSLPQVAGGPFCAGDACRYTNRKVIAARSYVEQLVYFYEDDTRPDDLSPRDRVGHGTAVAMVAGGAPNASPVGNVSGMAPKAYLGNYKIYGSPGVNDLSFNTVIIQALDDAFRDGMDLAFLSSASPAGWGPEDAGSTCGNTGSAPCDPLAAAMKAATSRGFTVIVAAGNSGADGQFIPTYNSIESPGTEPTVITVGATTNSHLIFQTVAVTGGDAPAGLRQIDGRFGNGPLPSGPITAPLRDVSKLNDNGQACSALTNGSLAGAFALVQRGSCTFRTKVLNAANAGALGVVLMLADGQNSVYAPSALRYTPIPLVLIGNTDGKSLQSFLTSNPDRPVTLNPSLREVYDAQKYADFMAEFSSYGPAIRTSGVKPEVVAPGSDMVVATQNYDPNGDMYSANRFVTVDGTSFSAPMVAGAVALLKQRNRSWGPKELKSAVVNTATDKVDDFDNAGKIIAAGARGMGAGKLQMDVALRTNLTVDPAVISLGTVPRGSNTLRSVGLTFRNHSTSTLTLSLRIVSRQADANSRLTLSSERFTLQAGATSSPVTVQLDARSPAPGVYEGVVTVDGGAVPLRIPYMYLVGDGVPANVLPLANYNFEGIAGFRLQGGFMFKVVDKYGVPVPNLNVRWRVVQGGANLADLVASRTTDDLGIADASTVILGPQLGVQVFEAAIDQVPDPLSFVGFARLTPAINTAGIVNGASFEVGRGVAPGSWVTIQGRGLADAAQPLITPYVPLSLGNVSVGIDTSGVRRSYPARLAYVSDGQVNIQLPWELQGQPSAKLKVSIGNFSSALKDFTVTDYSPAPFQYLEATTGRALVVAVKANTADVISPALPAERGSFITIYANGLGPVSNTPPTGEVAKAEPLSQCQSNPAVTFGGAAGNVIFCGLTPNSAGLYQINVQVPGNAPTDLQDVVITVNGISSTPVKMPIR